MTTMRYSPERTATWLRPMLSLAFLLAFLANAFPQIQLTYTGTGTSTFTPPTGVTSVTVECWGGGGRGGSKTSSGNGGGGGGGGAYSRSTLTVVPATNYTVTVGAGATSASAGGDSWFGTTGTILAKGGSSVANNSSTGAAGGLASGGVGTTKYNGGDGITVTGSNGGGGGSSAGSGADGVDATGSTGATAPADGGNGGNGTTSGNNPGGAASDPGGGGGGARRTGGISTQAGGAGGDGRVVITYNYTEGTCLTASPTIPDAGCGTSTTYTVTLPQTGLPTTLGTSAGNARFSSVELIFAHPFNRDLDVTLTSPAGTTRNIMLDRFGQGVNIGNPATCVPVVLQDGAGTMPTADTDDATGTYAPEAALSGFTGNPNGDWILNICDDGALDLGSFRFGRLNFCTVVAPSVTAAVTTGTNPTCTGNSVTFTATPTNGGASPTYQWQKNGTNISGATGVTYTATAGTNFVNNDQIRVVMTSNAACTTTTTATSTAITMTVPATVTPSVTAAVTTGTNPTCSGTSITFTATPTNGGASPTYQWTKNGTNISGATAVTYTGTAGTAFVNGDVIRVVMTSNATCPSTPTATSTGITMTVNPVLTPSVTTAITTGSNPACNGSSVTFTATPTNGGTPTYQWTKNGTNISGATAVTYTGTAGTAFVNGDLIRVVMTSTATCASPTTATSTAITMTVTPTVTPSVSIAITSGSNPVCNGGSVTFTPTPTNGGASPTYQWQKGGVNISGATGSTYTAVAGTDFVNTNQIRVVMTSTATCPSPATATSTAITMTVTPTVTPSVTIAVTTGTNPTCTGSNVTFTATPTNGGAGPTYQWTKNGTNISGATSVTYTGAAGTDFANTDLIRVVMTSNATCPSPATGTSTAITMTVVQPPTTANAGSNLTACVSSGTATMAANNPSVGTGAWSFVSGPATPGITTPSSNVSNITGMTTAGSYVFRWTTSNNPCTQSTSDVTIVSYALPTSANAGSPQTICTSPGSATMAANNPSIGTGAWTQVSGPVTATITTPGSNISTITGMTTSGSYVFRWTTSNGPCATSASNVTITANAPPTTASAGPTQSICTSVGTAVMAANAPSVGTASWSQVSGPSAASIVSSSSPTTTINGLTTAGTYVFRWTISNNPCTQSTSDVSIDVAGVPTTANAGSPQTICAASGTVTMNGNTPTVGTGTWSQLSGPVTGSIADVNLPGTAITGLTTVGTYVFRWRITSNPCTASQSSVTITVAPTPTVADAGIDQDICVSPGMTTMAANNAAVGSGSWSQISGPATASIVDASDELTDISGFNLVGDYVFRWTIAGTGCPSTDNDVTVHVFGSPSTADAGPDQPICSTIGDATMAAATPGVGTGAWTQVSGPVTATIVDDTDPATVISGMTTVGTYIFRWTISNGPCSVSMDDVEIASGPCAYYSRGTGDVSDAIWSETPTGSTGLATFTTITSMIIQSGDVVTNTSDVHVGDVDLQTGGTLVLNGATTLNVHGDNVALDGTLSAADNSTVALVGNSATTVSTTGSPSFFDLTVDNGAGASLSGSAVIRGTLLLEDGAFDAGTAQLVMESTASYTGRLGPVAPTASYVGDLTMQRYIPAGRTNWRMMGSPVSGQTVNNWKDDYITAGFPGSHYPTFSNPTGSGILWPSIRWYDETNTGAAVLDGLTGATGAGQSLAAGQGFASWCGSGFTTTTAFTVDVTGNPNVASSPIQLPMSYTPTGAGGADGWNMVSNPLPSPIAFDQISRGANVADFITYFDPATGNNATYDIGLSDGTNGGTNIIQSSQAFWLKASGSAVTTTVDESDKVADNSGGFFGGDEVLVSSIVRLNIHSAINQYSDETLIVFSQGSPETNDDDVPKFVFAHPEAPQVATLGDNGTVIAINAFGPYTTNISIPVLVNVAVNGDYSITATGLANVGLSCLRMEDLQTGDITPLEEGATYTFTALAGDDETIPRLLLHASAPLPLTLLDATCAGRDDGSATVDLDGGTADVLWMDATDAVILEQNNVTEGAIMALEAGDYNVQVSSSVGCGALHTTFSIDEPSAMEATAIAEPTSCPASEDGTIDLSVLGGVAPYTFVWNTNAVSEDLTVAAGTYTVDISDANGCNMAPQEYVVSAGEGPEVGISVESSTVMVNDAITFFSASGAEVAHSWDFGDDSTSEEVEPVHSYSEPGTYTVTLTVDDGTCSNTTTLELVVESTTGLPTIVGATLNAWVSGDFFVVDHNFTNNEPVMVRILSTNGQLLQQHRFAAAPARLTLSNADLATGIYLLRVSNGTNVRTFTVPVVH